MNPVLIKRKALVYLAGTFLAGLIAGGFGGYHWNKGHPPRRHSPDQMAEGMEKVLRKELALTEEQALKTRPILEETARKIQEAFKSTGATVDQYFQENNRQLSEFLTPEQIEKLKTLEERRKQFHNKRGKGAHPGGPKDGASLVNTGCSV